MKFEEIEVGQVYAEEHNTGYYLVTYKAENYILIINYSIVHHVAVPQFFGKDYDYSGWYIEDDYYSDQIYNHLIVRKSDEWSDTFYYRE